MSKPRLSIGLDIGGTKIAAGLMDGDGTVVRRRVLPTEAHQGGEVVLHRVLGLVEGLAKQAATLGADLLGVGVATPGIVDVREGTVTFASNNLPGWTGTPIGPAIRDHFGLPAWADNDGNLALVGELQFGAAKGARSALMITLGTGVGGAIALDGRVLRGAHGSAGKFGHMPVSQSGPLCSCGRHGCLEAYASGPTVVRLAVQRFGFTGTTEQLLTMAQGGNAPAARVFRLAGERLGMALVAAVNLLDPGLCLLSGGLVAAGDLILAPARRALAARAHPTIAGRTSLQVAALGSDAGLLGAAYLPWNPSVLGIPLE